MPVFTLAFILSGPIYQNGAPEYGARVAIGFLCFMQMLLGLPRKRVARYALRAAMGPIYDFDRHPLRLYMLSGAVLVESVFFVGWDRAICNPLRAGVRLSGHSRCCFW